MEPPEAEAVEVTIGVQCLPVSAAAVCSDLLTAPAGLLVHGRARLKSGIREIFAVHAVVVILNTVRGARSETPDTG